MEAVITSMYHKTAGPWCTLLLIVFGFNIGSLAQEKKDTVSSQAGIDTTKFNKGVKKLLGLITRVPEVDQSPFTIKSEDPFLKYEGKIIRKINIRRIGFDKIVLDTAYTFRSFIANTANNLHTDTKESVIRNHLFIREGRPLNAYRVADNERTIRNLEFILDARIFVKPISKSSDSVDLLIVTRDVFSLGGSVSTSLPGKYRIRIRDINIAGLGHYVQVGQIYDQRRTPRYAYEGFYQINNIKGSFIDASLGYTKLNRGISVGNENERSVYFKLSRALYQPFARFAGAIEYSDNLSRNVYSEADSTFSRYHYRIQDYWIGYSIGHKRLPKNLRENRNRTFLALRSFKQYFLKGATNIDLTEPDRFAYRDRLSILAQLTFFRQDFYKTQYVLGFGRTEDVPHGYRISFTGGWERELQSKRPYVGSELNYNKVQATGTILTFNLKVASFWNGSDAEDGLFSFDFTKYSKINKIRRSIIRTQFESGYAVLFNQNVKRGIDIRDLNGIAGFLTDSLVGLQRFTIAQEATIFTPWKVLGFRMAPTGRVEFALIQRSGKFLQARNLFAGLSVGLRARNENLIFNTFEARIFYYPRIVEGLDHFRATIITNFRIRYPTNLVNKPSTVFPYY
ncbi:hypothetical protein [Chryseolinea sp. H1M3-3]|uniref:hypothetical protein n=1 Tax=Chryseolinea sp. H1M3-3 TaxID=3034144 RepID=UPI0023EC140D|nr:hypothetical protein [Chryseolinea sp. H1M3-3]